MEYEPHASDDQLSDVESDWYAQAYSCEVDPESDFESTSYAQDYSSPPSSPPSVFNLLQNLREEVQSSNLWESNETNATSSLASLYRPPYEIIHKGDFHHSKIDASIENKWLIVNIQSKDEFNSHVLNRDTWSNEALSHIIRENFIFWQVYDDTTEGEKVKNYYCLDSIPAILLLDPITGQKMRSWCGVIKAESFSEDLIQFMDERPQEALPSKSKNKLSETEASNNEEETSWNEKEEKLYPPLPEEPKTPEGNVCRIGLRFPDGRSLKRNFLLTDSIQLLWSFCNSQLKEGELQRPLKLMVAIPGASRVLDYDREENFRESGLSNSLISVDWE